MPSRAWPPGHRPLRGRRRCPRVQSAECAWTPSVGSPSRAGGRRERRSSRTLRFRDRRPSRRATSSPGRMWRRGEHPSRDGCVSAVRGRRSRRRGHRGRRAVSPLRSPPPARSFLRLGDPAPRSRSYRANARGNTRPRIPRAHVQRSPAESRRRSSRQPPREQLARDATPPRPRACPPAQPAAVRRSSRKRRRRRPSSALADQAREVTTADRNMDSALNLTVERARPIPFSLTSGEAREEAANRRTNNRWRAADLRKGDLSGWPLGEQAAFDWIAAADKRARRLNPRPAELKQARTASEQPQLEQAVPLSSSDETPSDSLDLMPVGET